MNAAPTSPPSRPRKAVLRLALPLLAIGFVGLGIAISLQIAGSGNRISVLLSVESGTLLVGDRAAPSIDGNSAGGTQVEWVCDPADPDLTVVEGASVRPEDWRRAIEARHPGATLGSIRESSRSSESTSIDGRTARTAIATHARLRIERSDGSVEPALGIAAAVAEGDGMPVRSYLMIVQWRDADGSLRSFDGSPVFNDRPVPWLERARGFPAHRVRFDLTTRADEGD